MERWLGVRAPVVRSFAIFVASLLVFFTLLRMSLLHGYVGEPLARLFAAGGSVVLNLLSLKAQASGTHLSFDGFEVRIDDVCTGIFVVAIYLSAVLAYPSPAKEKLKGFLLGSAVILFLNLIRVTSLMVIGRYLPRLFEAAHLLVWQSLVIFVALLVWIYWAERCAGASRS